VKPSSAIPVKSRNLSLLFSLCFIAIIIPVVTASGLQEVGAHANGPSFDPGYQMDTYPQRVRGRARQMCTDGGNTSLTRYF